MRFLSWLWWVIRGKPMVWYDGYNCGCCGKWVNRPMNVRDYQAYGWQSDTWGLCNSCVLGVIDYE